MCATVPHMLSTLQVSGKFDIGEVPIKNHLQIRYLLK